MRITGIRSYLLVCLLVLLAPMAPNAFALPQQITVGGQSFPDSVRSHDGTLLDLNGIGFRKVTIFKIKIYVAALYLTTKSDDAHEIIEQSGDKQLAIRFLHDVDVEDIQDAWVDNFAENNPDSGYVAKAKKIANVLPGMVTGDRLTINIGEEGISVSLNDKVLAKDPDVYFGQAVLRIWLGENPPNTSLQSGLLKLPDEAS